MPTGFARNVDHSHYLVASKTFVRSGSKSNPLSQSRSCRRRRRRSSSSSSSGSSSRGTSTSTSTSTSSSSNISTSSSTSTSSTSSTSISASNSNTDRIRCKSRGPIEREEEKTAFSSSRSCNKNSITTTADSTLSNLRLSSQAGVPCDLPCLRQAKDFKVSEMALTGRPQKKSETSQLDRRPMKQTCRLGPSPLREANLMM